MLSLRGLLRDSAGFEELPTKAPSKFRPARTSGIYASKTILKEHRPFLTELSPDVNGNYIYFNEHFIYSAGLALTYTDTDYQFSPTESRLWDAVVKHYDGEVIDVKDAAVCELLDFWLTEEIQGNAHPEIETRAKG